jgi:hypothetical protein
MYSLKYKFVTPFLLITTFLLLSGCSGSGGSSSGPETNNTQESEYLIGGTVSGLSGSGLVIQNNGSDNLIIESNGAFEFPATLLSTEQYDVTIFTQPNYPGVTCNITNGTGIVNSNADIDDIYISCNQQIPVLTIDYETKSLEFSWTTVAKADYYLVHENVDGSSGFNQLSGELVGSSFDLQIPSYGRLNASYMISACNTFGCVDSVDEFPTTLNSVIGYFKASNTDFNDHFGTDVVLSDDGTTLVVSARGESSDATGADGPQMNDNSLDSGAAYVFVRQGDTWAQQAFLKPSNTDDSDSFGLYIALSADGNTLAISAPEESSGATGINGDEADNGESGSGAAYIFVRTNNVWSQQAYIKASNTERNDEFGSSIALSSDGGILAVGARSEDSNATGIGGDESNNDESRAGAVYIFKRSNQEWSQQEYIKASNTDAADNFGHALSLSGNGQTLAVGAYLENSESTGVNGSQTPNDIFSRGAAYVYVSNNDNWSQQAYLKASNTDTGDLFGQALSTSDNGNTLAISAHQESSNATGVNGVQSNNDAANSGAVYIFERESGVWSQSAYIKASNTELGDQFGYDVSLSNSGETLAVSAFKEDSSSLGLEGGQLNNDALNSGAVYVYKKSDQTWSQQAYVKATNTYSDDRFGVSVSLAGDGKSLVVGADYEDGQSSGVGGSQSRLFGESGSVYLY